MRPRPRVPLSVLLWVLLHPWITLGGFLCLEALLPVALQPSAWVLRGSIRLYQLTLSPHVPSECPFHPTCSQYGLECIRRHGTLKGGILTTWRLLRCHPWTSGGQDPVPDDRQL